MGCTATFWRSRIENERGLPDSGARCYRGCYHPRWSPLALVSPASPRLSARCFARAPSSSSLPYLLHPASRSQRAPSPRRRPVQQRSNSRSMECPSPSSREAPSSRRARRPVSSSLYFFDSDARRRRRGGGRGNDTTDAGSCRIRVPPIGRVWGNKKDEKGWMA
jgi:hypothetical protein